jgi:hypothetical protein
MAQPEGTRSLLVVGMTDWRPGRQGGGGREALGLRTRGVLPYAPTYKRTVEYHNKGLQPLVPQDTRVFPQNTPVVPRDRPVVPRRTACHLAGTPPSRGFVQPAGTRGRGPLSFMESDTGLCQGVLPPCGPAGRGVLPYAPTHKRTVEYRNKGASAPCPARHAWYPAGIAGVLRDRAGPGCHFDRREKSRGWSSMKGRDPSLRSG